MTDKKWKAFLKNKWKEYRKIGRVFCPVLGNEYVYFNRRGFNHLIRKGRKLRLRSEQLRKVMLIPYAIKVIHVAKQFKIQRADYIGDSSAQFLVLECCFIDRKVKVILRRINKGRIHFFSVMDKKQKPPNGGPC